MARIGTKKNPAVLRARTLGRAQELIDFCTENDIQAVVGVEPDKPEDVSDLDRALSPSVPARAHEKVGRNEPCPCGSGRKAKKCCPELTR